MRNLIESKEARKIVTGDYLALAYGMGPIIVARVNEIENIEGDRIEFKFNTGRISIVDAKDDVLVVI